MNFCYKNMHMKRTPDIDNLQISETEMASAGLQESFKWRTFCLDLQLSL